MTNEQWWLVGGKNNTCALIRLDGERNQSRANINLFLNGGIEAVYAEAERPGIRIAATADLPDALYVPQWWRPNDCAQPCRP